MRVHDDRISILPPSHQLPHLGNYRRGAAIRSVDVKPEPVSAGERRDILYRIDTGRRSRSYRRDNAEQPRAALEVRLNRSFQCVDAHAKIPVSRDTASALAADAQGDSRLLDGR